MIENVYLIDINSKTKCVSRFCRSTYESICKCIIYICSIIITSSCHSPMFNNFIRQFHIYSNDFIYYTIILNYSSLQCSAIGICYSVKRPIFSITIQTSLEKFSNAIFILSVEISATTIFILYQSTNHFRIILTKYSPPFICIILIWS